MFPPNVQQEADKSPNRNELKIFQKSPSIMLTDFLKGGAYFNQPAGWISIEFSFDIGFVFKK